MDKRLGTWHGKGGINACYDCDRCGVYICCSEEWEPVPTSCACGGKFAKAPDDTARLDWLERNFPRIWELTSGGAKRLANSGFSGETIRSAIDNSIALDKKFDKGT